jgi:phosphotransferase system enzyme I (PtsI)
MSERKGDSLVLRGIGACPGVAIGPAFFLDKHKAKVLPRTLERNEIQEEQQRFIQAVSQAEEQISRLMAEIPEELREHTGILQSHLLMLKDRMVYDNTLRLIAEEGINAEWALNRSLEHVRELFNQIKEPYIRERIRDVDYVVYRVLDILSGRPSMDLTQLENPVVVVAHDLSPVDTVQMRPDKILAFVTDMGSRTSHTAILARSLEIPAVVGLENACSTIFSGEILVVDGLSGDVTIAPDSKLLERYREKQRAYLRYKLDIIYNSHLPAETEDGFRIKTKANIELLEEIPSVLSHGSEGVGLLRTEFLYLADKELPSEETMFSAYREVAECLAPYPVTIRTLDIGGDKFISSVSFSEEINPALGLRAVRLCLKEPRLFRTQLRAILRASAYGHVSILIPLISGCLEIIQVKEHLEAIKEELRRDGVPFDKDIKLGIMIEVPSAVLVADILAKHVDFFSIGTNDLIQYSLAIDRGNEHVAHLYQPLHPGILRMIHSTVEAAHEAGIGAAMCGEMAGEPMYAPILVGMGLDELSMNSIAIPRVKRMIRQCSHERCSQLVRNLLESSSSEETATMLSNFLLTNFPDELDLNHGTFPGLPGRVACNTTPE